MGFSVRQPKGNVISAVYSTPKLLADSANIALCMLNQCNHSLSLAKHKRWQEASN